MSRASPDVSEGKESACNAGATGDAGLIPGLGRSLEKGMATHSSILAWRIWWIEEAGGLQSIGLQRVRYHWSYWAQSHMNEQALYESAWILYLHFERGQCMINQKISIISSPPVKESLKGLSDASDSHSFIFTHSHPHLSFFTRWQPHVRRHLRVSLLVEKEFLGIRAQKETSFSISLPSHLQIKAKVESKLFRSPYMYIKVLKCL